MIQSETTPDFPIEIHPSRSILAERISSYASSIFGEMSALAREYNAINLGQGAPDASGPAALLQETIAAIQEGFNQYPPPRGYLDLREAVVRQISRDYGLQYDPESECMITFGATEGLTAALMSTVNPGDEVLVFEPFYDSYAAIIDLIGARKKLVPIEFTGSRWSFTLDRVENSISPDTRVILLNSPHNPTGAVISEAELAQLAQIVEKHNLIVICDEVYEYLVYGSAQHIPFASLPGMRERTIRISSAAKTFSVTGWKTGWVSAPAPLLHNALILKQHMTFSGSGPFQLAIAKTWNQEHAWIMTLRQQYAENMQALSRVLDAAGVKVYPSAGTFFLLADMSPLGWHNGRDFCLVAPEKIGIAAVPVSALSMDHARWNSVIRFSFAKNPDILAQAFKRLQLLTSLHPKAVGS